MRVWPPEMRRKCLGSFAVRSCRPDWTARINHVWSEKREFLAETKLKTEFLAHLKIYANQILDQSFI